MASSLDQIMAELENTYKPQKDLYSAQLAQLPAQYEAQTQGLNVAKENAFRDILGAASARGIAYSGMPIQEQTRYTGEKYLPALAALKADQNQRQFSLQDALAKILQGQTSQAYDLRNAQLKAEQEAAQAEWDRQFKLQQLAMQRRSGGGGRAPSASDRISAATQDAMSALQFAKSNPGKVQDRYRESVANQLMAQYGIDSKTTGSIIGNIFPNGWEWQYGIRK